MIELPVIVLILLFLDAFVLGYAFHDWCRYRAGLKTATIERSKSYEAGACDQCGCYTLELIQGTLACDTCGATMEAPYQ